MLLPAHKGAASVHVSTIPIQTCLVLTSVPMPVSWIKPVLLELKLIHNFIFAV